MKSAFKAIFLILIILTASTLATRIFAQQEPIPSVYQPPHPYPSPDAPDFPKPGNFMMQTVGFTVDQIADTTKYFRSDTFQADMQDIIRQSQTTQCMSAVSNYFDTVKQTALAKIQNGAQKLMDKKNQIYNEPALNDNMTSGDNSSIPYINSSTTDDQLKTDVLDFFNRQYAALYTNSDSYYIRAQNAASCDELKQIAADARSYIDSDTFQTEVKTLGARVMAERINHFSYVIQQWVDFNMCIAPQLDALMNTDLYERYVYSPDSLFYTDWYQTTTFPDARRSWTKFNYQPMDTPPGTTPAYIYYESMGAREEYRQASYALKTPLCIGAPSAGCKDTVHMHMRAGKYLLQDMFHIAWWEYDYILQYNEQHPDNPIGPQDLDLQTCPIPTQTFHTISGTQPSNFPSMNFPTGSSRQRLNQR